MALGRAGRVFGLPRIDMEDADLGVGTIPVRRDGVKDEAEIAFVTGLERRGGDRLEIDVRIAGADQLERHGLILRDLFCGVAEKDLDGDGGDGAISLVGDLSVDVGDFAAGEVRGLAHDEAGDGEAGGVGIRDGGDRGDDDGLAAVLEDEDHDGCCQHDDSGGDGEGKPVAVARLNAGDQADFGLDIGV